MAPFFFSETETVRQVRILGLAFGHPTGPFFLGIPTRKYIAHRLLQSKSQALQDMLIEHRVKGEESLRRNRGLFGPRFAPTSKPTLVLEHKIHCIHEQRMVVWNTDLLCFRFFPAMMNPHDSLTLIFHFVMKGQSSVGPVETVQGTGAVYAMSPCGSARPRHTLPAKRIWWRWRGFRGPSRSLKRRSRRWSCDMWTWPWKFSRRLDMWWSTASCNYWLVVWNMFYFSIYWEE